MATKRMKTDVWYQVGGDVNPQDSGATLARWENDDSFALLEIQSVIELVGIGEAEDVGFPFWTREAWVDVSDLPSDWRSLPRAEIVNRVLEAAWDGDDDYVYWEEGTGGWSSDILPDPSSKIQWWRKQGHGWRTADSEFKETIERGW